MALRTWGTAALSLGAALRGGISEGPMPGLALPGLVSEALSTWQAGWWVMCLRWQTAKQEPVLLYPKCIMVLLEPESE